MNKFVLFTTALMMTVAAHAKSVAPTKEKISPATIDQTIRLADSDDNVVKKKISIVVVDHGLSTDVSPRYSVYLGYNSMAEMGNLSAAYLITNQAYSNVKAKRTSAGIYEVSYTEYREEQGMVTVTQRIDATAAFSADKKQRANCNEGFCDGYIKADISLTESVSSDNY
ncbi:hypothetical protein [Bdellovibrio sp. HCB337]|uniref:hypothetical protein n=1 Tax=Bdellovibrio sp. HCB337 TaxID=3394358 RepID=UPI0039A47AB9